MTTILLSSGHHGTCSAAFAKIKEQYDVLANCPVNKLLPSLYAKDVITLDDKKMMESKPLEKDRMVYLLDDVLIRSLRSDHGSKYNGFLKVLEESDDSSVTDLTRKLGEYIVYDIRGLDLFVIEFSEVHNVTIHTPMDFTFSGVLLLRRSDRLFCHLWPHT